MRCWDLREGRQLQQHDFSSQVLQWVGWEAIEVSGIWRPLLPTQGTHFHRPSGAKGLLSVLRTDPQAFPLNSPETEGSTKALIFKLWAY